VAWAKEFSSIYSANQDQRHKNTLNIFIEYQTRLKEKIREKKEKKKEKKKWKHNKELVKKKMPSLEV